MTEAEKALRSILDRQKAIYEELLSLAEQQGDALIARHTNALQEIEARQSTLLSQASRLEAKVASRLQELGETLGVVGDPTVSAVAGRMEARDGAALKALCADIQRTLVRLHRLIRVNAGLFESAMDCVRFTVQLLAGGCQPSAVCYPAMDARRRGASLVVDQRV
jgi:flagellar biosynthesis/type III secretory pathway chaperone